MSSSGFVPGSSPILVLNENFPSNAPLPSDILPSPCVSVPFHSAVAFLSAINFLLMLLRSLLILSQPQPRSVPCYRSVYQAAGCVRRLPKILYQPQRNRYPRSALQL